MLFHCIECNRIWREYSEATMAHLKVVSQYQVAMIEQNSDVLAALEPVLHECAEKRVLMRRAVMDHESTHNGIHSEADGQVCVTR